MTTRASPPPATSHPGVVLEPGDEAARRHDGEHEEDQHRRRPRSDTHSCGHRTVPYCGDQHHVDGDPEEAGGDDQGPHADGHALRGPGSREALRRRAGTRLAAVPREVPDQADADRARPWAARPCGGRSPSWAPGRRGGHPPGGSPGAGSPRARSAVTSTNGPEACCARSASTGTVHDRLTRKLKRHAGAGRHEVGDAARARPASASTPKITKSIAVLHDADDREPPGPEGRGSRGRRARRALRHACQGVPGARTDGHGVERPSLDLGVDAARGSCRGCRAW